MIESHVASLEARFDSELKRVDQRVEDMIAATTIRFTQVNEFRGALSDLSNRMATRRELDAFKEQYSNNHELLRGQVVEMGRRIDLSTGRSLGATGTVKGIAVMLSTLLVAIGTYTAFQASKGDHMKTQTVFQTTTVKGP